MKIHKLTHQSIRPYGRIIDSDCAREMSDGNGWGILLKVKSKGWRIAYLILRGRSFKRLECHDSPETFEPVRGRAVIALAVPGTLTKHLGPGPTRVYCAVSGPGPKYVGPKVTLFCLDKPIVLKKGVWHALYTLTKSSHIKIVENISLSSRFITLHRS